MLDNAGFATFYLVYAVFIIRGAWVDIFGLIDGSRQIRLSGLFGEIGARNLNLQTGFVWRGCDNVKVL